MLLDDEENKTPTPSEEGVEGEVVEETTVTETTTTSEEEEQEPVILPPKEDKKRRNIIVIIIIIIVIVAIVLALIFGLRGCGNDDDNILEDDEAGEVLDDDVTTPGEGLLTEGDGDGDGTGSGSGSGSSSGAGSDGESSGSGSGDGSGDGGESGGESSGGSGSGTGDGGESGGESGESSGNSGDGSGDGETDDDGTTSSEPEEAIDYPYEDEDTSDYRNLTIYSILNTFIYYLDERVTVDGATVTGIHGNTITIQQYAYSSYYNMEVDALSLPSGIKIGDTVNIIGTINTKYGRRVTLEEARVQLTGGTSSFSYYAKARLVNRAATDYFNYSGAITRRQYRMEYEVEKGSTEWNEYLDGIDAYRAFRVEWRNWYKSSSGSYSTGTDRGETYLVVYNDLSDDTKNFYDIFFDGTNQNDMTSVNKNFTTTWTGVASDAKSVDVQGESFTINDYHWFDCYAKLALYYDDFYIGFDEFETKYIQNYDYQVDISGDENITALVSGFFDDGDTVTVTGIFMEQHGRNITLQGYDVSSGQGTGYCMEVTLDESQYSDDTPTLDVPYAQLLTVKGTVRIHESLTLFDYTTTIEDAKIETFDESYGTNSNKTRLYYGGNSISAISNNIYGEYSAAYFHAGVQIYAMPDSWEPDEDGDYWFIGRLRYKSGSITYVLSEYIPVCIHADEQEGELKYWKAIINGNDTDSNVKLYKTYFDNDINYPVNIISSDAPEVGAGFEGIDVDEIIMSNFFQVHYFDESVTYKYTYNGTEYERSDDRYLSMDFNTGATATFSSNLGVEDEEG